MNEDDDEDQDDDLAALDELTALHASVQRSLTRLHGRFDALEELLQAVIKTHGGNRRFEALLAGHERRLARLEKPSR